MLQNPTFWVGLAFFVFLGILVYYKVPSLLATALDNRADTIRKELDEARRLREEAQAILADYERKQRDAEKEAEDIIALAKTEAEAFAAETRERLKEQLERRTRLAEDKIARAEEQATNEVRSMAVDVAMKVAERIIEKKMTPDAAGKLIDENIAELKTRLN